MFYHCLLTFKNNSFLPKLRQTMAWDSRWSTTGGSWRSQSGSSSSPNWLCDLECHDISLAVCRIRRLTYETPEVLFFGALVPRRCGEQHYSKTYYMLYLKAFHFLNFDYENTTVERMEWSSRCSSRRLNHYSYFTILAHLYLFWRILKQVQTWLLTQGFSLLLWKRRPLLISIQYHY